MAALFIGCGKGKACLVFYNFKKGNDMNTNYLCVVNKTQEVVDSFQSDVEREFALFHAWRKQTEVFVDVA